MTTRDPLKKELATERKEERKTEAEIEKQRAREYNTAQRQAGTTGIHGSHPTGHTGYGGTTGYSSHPAGDTGYGGTTVYSSHPTGDTGYGGTTGYGATTTDAAGYGGAAAGDTEYGKGGTTTGEAGYGDTVTTTGYRTRGTHPGHGTGGTQRWELAMGFKATVTLFVSVGLSVYTGCFSIWRISVPFE